MQLQKLWIKEEEYKEALGYWDMIINLVKVIAGNVSIVYLSTLLVWKFWSSCNNST